MLDKPIDQITEADLDQLVASGTPEGKQLDYKLVLPGSTDADKKEFLADVSAMANAAGGYLIYGVDEQRDASGKPTGVPIHPITGVLGVNSGTEILRLENILRDGLQPRLQGVGIKDVPLANGSIALVVKVPRSWNGPHVVDFKGHWRFYSRNNAGKYPLDLQEVRTALGMTESLAQRLNHFRQDRLAQVVANETPVPLVLAPRVVLHIMPLSMFDPTAIVSLSSFKLEDQRMRPVEGANIHHRINLEGHLVSTSEGDLAAAGYVQVFRSGAIEVVDTYSLQDLYGRNEIPHLALEMNLSAATAKYVSLLRDAGVSAPLMICLTLLGVAGHKMMTRGTGLFQKNKVIDRDALVLPGLLLEEAELQDAKQLLKPVFDMVWNAAGWMGSQNYDEQGRWNPDRLR